MDRAKQTFNLIQDSLGRLTPTHKMLMGSVVVVLLMTLFIVGQYAGNAKSQILRVPAERRAEAVELLLASNITAQVDAAGIRVSNRDHLSAHGLLTEERLLDGASVTDLLELQTDQSWVANRQQNLQKYNAAVARVMSQVISRWSFVDTAHVVIQTPLTTPGIGRRAEKPTAAVTLSTRNGTLQQHEVEGIARYIAGGVLNLSPSDVQIVTTLGHSYQVDGDEFAMSGRIHELRDQVEEHYRDKIFAATGHIAGIRIAVNAQLNATQSTRRDLSYKDDGKGSVLLPSTERSYRTESGQKSSGARGGAQPNTGTSSQDTGSKDATSSTSDEAETTYEGHPGMVETTTQDPGGQAVRVDATITIPRGYVASVWKEKNADAGAEPEDADIQTEFARIRDSLVSAVTPLINTSANRTAEDQDDTLTEGEVVIDMYHDFGTIHFGPGGGVMGLETGIANRLVSGGVIRDVGLGMLAVVSLFMMFRLVKTGTAETELPSAEELVGIPPQLQSESEFVGEAEEADAPMDAIELSDDQMRSSKLIEQVQEMVSANPGDASRLISKWINDE